MKINYELTLRGRWGGEEQLKAEATANALWQESSRFVLPPEDERVGVQRRESMMIGGQGQS